MEGIEVAGALKRVGGNQRLYRSLLGQFADQQEHAAETIRKSLDDQDRGSAERGAHTVKGVSANLGIVALNGIAAKLESAIKHQQDDGVPSLIASLGEEMAKAVSVIRAALAVGVKPASVKAGDPELAKPHLIKLRALLASDDGEALDYLLSAQESFAGVLTAQEFVTLEKEVGNFDFGAALAALDAAVDRLGLTLD
jgi:HPt (histidine-containing phosphotransfer) domain-containing protein